jgi:transcription elongation factor S-II
MSVEDEVLSIRKKMEKMTEPGQDQTQALDLLKALSKVNMNLTILTSTRIGMAVNSLRQVVQTNN